MLLKTIIAIIIGSTLGYLYYRVIGCSSGTACPISSNPYISIIWGSLMGAAFVWLK